MEKIARKKSRGKRTAEPRDPEAVPVSPQFAGQPLRPFNVQRQAAAQRMGMRYGTLGQEEMDKAAVDGFYSGILTDALIVCFLCSSPDSTALKAIRAPDAVLSDAMKWGDTQGVAYGNDRFAELCATFAAIMAPLSES